VRRPTPSTLGTRLAPVNLGLLTFRPEDHIPARNERRHRAPVPRLAAGGRRRAIPACTTAHGSGPTTPRPVLAVRGRRPRAGHGQVAAGHGSPVRPVSGLRRLKFPFPLTVLPFPVPPALRRRVVRVHRRSLTVTTERLVRPATPLMGCRPWPERPAERSLAPMVSRRRAHTTSRGTTATFLARSSSSARRRPRTDRDRPAPGHIGRRSARGLARKVPARRPRDTAQQDPAPWVRARWARVR